jgi:hypothetical protein
MCHSYFNLYVLPLMTLYRYAGRQQSSTYAAPGALGHSSFFGTPCKSNRELKFIAPVFQKSMDHLHADARTRGMPHTANRKFQSYVCSITSFLFWKSCRLWDNVERYGTARQGTDGNKIWRMRFVCRITKAIDTLRIYNIYCFCTVTMVTRTRLNVRPPI